MPQGYFLCMKKVPGTVILIHSLVVLVTLNHSPIDHSEEAIICVTKMRVYIFLTPGKEQRPCFPPRTKKYLLPVGVEMH